MALVDIKPKSELGLDDFDVPFFNDVKDLLSSDIEYDVACICTPNGLHAEQSIQLLENNKHVVCEKPMGLSKDNCERVMFKALQMSKHVFCVMQNRYSPPSEWIKSVIDDEVLGKIHM